MKPAAVSGISLFLATCALGLLIGCGHEDPNHSSAARKAADAMVPVESTLPKPVVATLTAEELCKQYVTNEAAADEAFKGKFIEITGDVVMPVSRGFGGDPFIIVSGAGPDKPGGRPFLRCFIAEDALKQAETLKLGKTINLRGFCEGKSSTDSRETLLDLKRCVVTKVEP